MKRKARGQTARNVWGTAAGVILALELWLVPSATTGSGITVVDSQVTYSFAQQATFMLRLNSDVAITQVYLFFQATGDSQTVSRDVAFENRGGETTATLVHDLRLYPLPPFSTVAFWWQVDDATGGRLTTERQQFTYADNRFQWEQLGDNSLAVHWIAGRGDPAFGQMALDVARTSLEEINAELRVTLPPSIHIYIYDSQSSLSAAMTLAGREWVGGQAHPELGVVVVAIPPEEGYTARMVRDIPHELTHLLIYQSVTPAGYRYVPDWLDEGLAVANERLPNPDYTVLLEEAYQEGRLLSLESLCVPFSPDPQVARLSYAQSGSVVEFIRQRYGAPAIRALLAAYAEGSSCTAGVERALGISLNGLETEWQTSLAPQAPWRVWVERIGLWVGLWLLSLLLAVPMIGGLRRRR